MDIYFTNEFEAPEKSLGAKVTGEYLAIPIARFVPLQQTGCEMNTAEDLFNSMNTYPHIIRKALGWTKEEFFAARDELRDTLRGHVSDRLLDFNDTARPHGGRIDPIRAGDVPDPEDTPPPSRPRLRQPR